MTTEPLPARHCIARALELFGLSAPIEAVERDPHDYRYTIVLARTLEEYGYQPPLDPIRKRARAICAEAWRRVGRFVTAAEYIAGDWDDSPMMQATEKALLERVEFTAEYGILIASTKGMLASMAECGSALRQLMAENERLRDTMKEIGHSMKQAGVPGNDWRREIKLTSSIVSAALGEQP